VRSDCAVELQVGKWELVKDRSRGARRAAEVS
jgi:hypothetical protein